LTELHQNSISLEKTTRKTSVPAKLGDGEYREESWARGKKNWTCALVRGATGGQLALVAAGLGME
jgi:hypothetical protein